MSRIRVRAALFAAVLATAVAGAVGMPASGSAYAPTTAAHKCSSARYVHARLSWGHKCLAAGQFCKVGNREYLRYGFYCPRSGHLRRR